MLQNELKELKQKLIDKDEEMKLKLESIKQME